MESPLLMFSIFFLVQFVFLNYGNNAFVLTNASISLPYIFMRLYFGIQTSPENKYLPIIFQQIRNVKDHFFLSNDTTIVCIYMYKSTNPSEQTNCAFDQVQLDNLVGQFEKRMNDHLGFITAEEAVDMMWPQIMKDSGLHSGSRIPILVVNQDGLHDVQKWSDISKRYFVKHQILPFAMVPFEERPAPSANEIQTKTILKNITDNEIYNITSFYTFYIRLKNLQQCFLFYPICRYSTVLACLPNWWRKHLDNEAECPYNPDSGMPSWDSPAICASSSDCDKFCENKWAPDCSRNSACGSEVARKQPRPTDQGLFYAAKNCPPFHQCPPCTTTLPVIVPNCSTCAPEIICNCTTPENNGGFSIFVAGQLLSALAGQIMLELVALWEISQ